MNLSEHGKRPERRWCRHEGPRQRSSYGDPVVSVISTGDVERSSTRAGYARERLSSLTTHGVFGPMRLPATNVVNLLQALPYEESTGAKQLVESGRASERAGDGTDSQD